MLACQSYGARFYNILCSIKMVMVNIETFTTITSPGTKNATIGLHTLASRGLRCSLIRTVRAVVTSPQF